MGRLIHLKQKHGSDLSARREAGENVDRRNIKKHKNDVFRLSILLTTETRIIVPDSIHADLSDFLSAMKTESVDLEQFGIRNQDQKEILDKIAAAYIKKTSYPNNQTYIMNHPLSYTFVVHERASIKIIYIFIMIISK